MPFLPPPYLLPPRSGDCHFNRAASPWHQATLSVSQVGRVRLEMTIPWIGPPPPGRHALSIALVWPKGKPLPTPSRVAATVADTLQSARPSKTRGPGLDRFPLTLERWTGEIFTRKADRALLPHAPKVDVCLCVREVLAWVSRVLSHRWPSFLDRREWIYRAHWLTALLVSDEIATRYLEDRASLGDTSALRRAEPMLRQRIEAAYRTRETSPRVTPRRFALALVDQVFEPLFPVSKRRLYSRLLDPTRKFGLDDGKLWYMILPPEDRKRLKALCPAESVYALLSWRETERELNDAANWFLSWWWILVNVGGPYYPGVRPSTEPPPSPEHPAQLYLLEVPGVGEWAAHVWDALYK